MMDRILHFTMILVLLTVIFSFVATFKFICSSPTIKEGLIEHKDSSPGRNFVPY